MSARSVKAEPGSAKLFATLMLLALVGVGSLALAPIGQLAPPGFDPGAFRWLALVQPGILALCAALLGHMFARRVDLDAPLLRAILTGGPAGQVALRQVGPALLGGLLSGAVLLLYASSRAAHCRPPSRCLS